MHRTPLYHQICSERKQKKPFEKSFFSVRPCLDVEARGRKGSAGRSGGVTAGGRPAQVTEQSVHGGGTMPQALGHGVRGPDGQELVELGANVAVEHREIDGAVGVGRLLHQAVEVADLRLSSHTTLQVSVNAPKCQRLILHKSTLGTSCITLF